MLRSRPQRSLFLLGLASALIYLLAFTLPYCLPTYFLHVENEIYSFAAREPWRGILFYLAIGTLFGLYWLACRLACRVHGAASSGRGGGVRRNGSDRRDFRGLQGLGSRRCLSASPHSLGLSRILPKLLRNSIGTGKMIVEFFSTAISVSVCR